MTKQTIDLWKQYGKQAVIPGIKYAITGLAEYAMCNICRYFVVAYMKLAVMIDGDSKIAKSFSKHLLRRGLKWLRIKMKYSEKLELETVALKQIMANTKELRYRYFHALEMEGINVPEKYYKL